MGAVHHVDGMSVLMVLPRAADIPSSIFGHRLAFGEIGEFVVIDVGGKGVFGRLLEVEVAPRELEKDGVGRGGEPLAASAKIQLLSTLNLDGTYQRGVSRHPRIGDEVYAAGADVLEAIVSGVSHSGDGTNDVLIGLGKLSVGDGVPVQISASRLFGRHLAILGATGAGKSWTLAHLLEEVAARRGRVLLIDATGEFHSLGDIARHVSLGVETDSPLGTTRVSLPHREFSEADRNAFLRPSGGVQLPKLRAAIRALRLAHALGAQHPLVDADGLIRKQGRERGPVVQAERDHVTILDDPHAPFDLGALPQQIAHECIFEIDRNDSSRFGGWANNDISFCNSLIARVMDLLQTDVVAQVVNPSEALPSLVDVLSDWLNDEDAEPILRVSLRNLAFSHHVREIVANTIGRRLLSMARGGSFLTSPLVVAVDEAHQFFGQTIGDEFTAVILDAFDSIAKEGRKYGLTICMATQRPGDLNAAVLSQAGMMIVHRLADRRDRERVEQAASELDQSATKFLPTLVPGEGLLVGADFPVPLPVQIDPPQRHPSSRGPDYGAWIRKAAE